MYRKSNPNQPLLPSPGDPFSRENGNNIRDMHRAPEGVEFLSWSGVFLGDGPPKSYKIQSWTMEVIDSGTSVCDPGMSNTMPNIHPIAGSQESSRHGSGEGSVFVYNGFPRNASEEEAFQQQHGQ